MPAARLSESPLSRHAPEAALARILAAALAEAPDPEYARCSEEPKRKNSRRSASRQHNSVTSGTGLFLVCMHT